MSSSPVSACLSKASLEPDMKEVEVRPLPRETIIACIKQIVTRGNPTGPFFKADASDEQDRIDTIDFIKTVDWASTEPWLVYMRTHPAWKAIQHLEQDIRRACYKHPEVCVQGDTLKVYREEGSDQRIEIKDLRTSTVNRAVMTELNLDTLKQVLIDIVEHGVPSNMHTFTQVATKLDVLTKSLALTLQWCQAGVSPLGPYMPPGEVPLPDPKVLVRFVSTATYRVARHMFETTIKVSTLLPGPATEILLRLLNN